MKINNKGMTLVELLVTFSLLLIIVVGLYNLILEVKFEIDDRQIIKDVTEYSSLMNNDIHYNLLVDKPFLIAIKDTSSSNWSFIKHSKYGSGVVYNVGSTTVSVSKDGITKSIPIGDHEGICKNIYPCAIYYYFNEDKTVINSRVIALNRGLDVENSNFAKKGILYGNTSKPIYEYVPNDEFIEIRDSDVEVLEGTGEVTTVKGNRLYIEVSDGVLVINYGLYVIENDQNYGFKIAMPF